MTTIPNEVPIALDHHKRAEEIIEMLRAEVEQIEGFGHPPADRRRKVAGFSSNISEVELNAAAAACDATPELAAAARMTGAGFREGLSFCSANTKLADQLEVEAAGIRYAVRLKSAILANRARHVYQTAQSLNKPVDLLVPHIDKLRAAFKRPKKRAAPPTDPAPSPPPATPDPKAGK
ncbi:MAG TPA: hypothetical protein VE974_01600 [Thermoanaerobaculia bacterium]|nr:hypothetical protein [Thermoanaerobaculia bacterium]